LIIKDHLRIVRILDAKELRGYEWQFEAPTWVIIKGRLLSDQPDNLTHFLLSQELQQKLVVLSKFRHEIIIF